MEKTPRLLGENDKQAVLNYIAYEPEMNMFMYGDIDQFGMSEPVSVYALEDDEGNWDSIVLRFYANFVCYSQNPLFDAESMAEFIQECTGGTYLGSINGKFEVIEALSPYFEGLDLRGLQLAFLDLVYHDDIDKTSQDVEIRRLTEDDYDELFELLGSMYEYRGLYADQASIEMAKKQKATNEKFGCMSYGAFIDGKLV